MKICGDCHRSFTTSVCDHIKEYHPDIYRTLREKGNCREEDKAKEARVEVGSTKAS